MSIPAAIQFRLHAYCSSVDARSCQNKFLIQMSLIFHANSYKHHGYWKFVTVVFANTCLWVMRDKNCYNKDLSRKKWEDNGKNVDATDKYTHNLLYWCLKFHMHFTVGLSVESLPSNLASQVPFPAESGILISILGMDVCPLCFVLCVSGGGPDVLLNKDSGRSAHVYLTTVLVQSLWLPYRHLTHVYLSWNSGGCESCIDWG